MNKEDFYDLYINQGIWYKGKRYEIASLSSKPNTGKRIELIGLLDIYSWDYIYKRCSLKEPLEIKKFKEKKWLNETGNIQKGALLEFMNTPNEEDMELFFSFVKHMVDGKIEI